MESKGIRLAENLIEEFPLPLDYQEINVKDFLELFDFKIASIETGTFNDRLLSFIDIVETFSLYKLLVFVNIKNYFSNAEMVEIYKYCAYKKVKLLIIEGIKQSELLEYEKKLRINEDFTDELLYN